MVLPCALMLSIYLKDGNIVDWKDHNMPERDFVPEMGIAVIQLWKCKIRFVFML